eukprot:gene40183-54333_t
MDPPSHLRALQALELALRTGSLTGAAARLAITPAAVGQRVKALEDYLGIDLLVRGRSGLQPTPELSGALVHLHAAFRELALAADRTYMLALPDAPEQAPTLTLNAFNFGLLPMVNDQSRLQRRFYEEAGPLEAVRTAAGRPLDADAALALGLVTAAPDDIDWADEIRIAIEERAAMSPDALTGLEANLRFASKENMNTRIFGRLTAWQNWIFNRPNAVGEKGALGEDSDQRPVFPAPRATRAGDDLRLRDPIENENDLGMRKVGQAEQRRRAETGGIQLDPRPAGPPVVIDGLFASAPHMSDGFERERGQAGRLAFEKHSHYALTPFLLRSLRLTQPALGRLRRFWLDVHLWRGVGLFVVLAPLGVSGGSEQRRVGMARRARGPLGRLWRDGPLWPGVGLCGSL